MSQEDFAKTFEAILVADALEDRTLVTFLTQNLVEILADLEPDPRLLACAMQDVLEALREEAGHIPARSWMYEKAYAPGKFYKRCVEKLVDQALSGNSGIQTRISGGWTFSTHYGISVDRGLINFFYRVTQSDDNAPRLDWAIDLKTAIPEREIALTGEDRGGCFASLSSRRHMLLSCHVVFSPLRPPGER